MSNRIFISYRREGSKYQARMIYQAFLKMQPTTEVFMDVDSIPLGVNFAKIIRGWVQKCDVLLALVGKDWSESQDPKTGLRRLDNPNDFVRIEISEALDRGIPVVPVLLDDAHLPDSDKLPDELRNLFDRQAAFVSFRTFDSDVESLISRLKGASKQDIAEPAPSSGSEPGAPAKSLSTADTSTIITDKGLDTKPDDAPWRRQKVVLLGIMALLIALLGAAVFYGLSGSRLSPDPNKSIAHSEPLPEGAKVPSLEKKEPPTAKVQNGQNCVEIPLMDNSQFPPKQSIITRCK